MRWAALIAVLSLVFLLGVKSFREPDLWWMLRTGEWIVQNGEIVREDPFSFTYHGTSWTNVKWLFEVLIYFIQKLLSAEWVILLQSFVNVAMLLCLLQAKRLATHVGIGAGTILWCVAWMVSLEYRMTGRPEMMSHLFTALFLFILYRHQRVQDRWFWLLVPLQALWANVHEGYGVGYAVLGAFFMDGALNFRNSKYRIETLLMPLAAVASVAIHPYGPKMVLHPLEIFGQLGENKFTVELYSIFTGYFWEQFQSWLFVVAFVLSCGILLSGFVQKGKKMLGHAPIWYLVMLVLFAYLATTAHRNIPFFMIWSFPVIAGALDNGFTWKWFSHVRARTAIYMILILVLAVGWYGVVSNKFYALIGSKGKFGLYVPPVQNPMGASDFIKEHNLQDAACFSDFLVSSYLMWDLRPSFKSYIDLRDLDVFPASHFQQLAQMGYYTSVFEQEDKKYGFDYAVLYRPQFEKLHQYLGNHPQWKLVFVDLVAAVYVKDSTIQSAEIFQPLKSPKMSAGAKVFNSLLSFGAFEPDPSVNEHATAAQFFSSIGYGSLAIEQAKKASEAKGLEQEGLVALGDAWHAYGNKLTDLEGKQVAFVNSSKAFAQALKLNRRNTEAMRGMAQLAFAAGDMGAARQYISRGIKERPENPDWYLLSAQVNGALSHSETQNQQMYVDAFVKDLVKYLELNPGDIPVTTTLGVTLCQLDRCNEAKQYLEKTSGYPGMADADKQSLMECKRKCGASG